MIPLLAAVAAAAAAAFDDQNPPPPAPRVIRLTARPRPAAPDRGRSQ